MNSPKGTSGKTINRLTIKQLFEICKFLEDLQSTFDCTTTRAQLAVKAGNYFGYVVSPDSIKTCMEIADLAFPEPPATENQRLAIMKRAIEAVYEQFELNLPAEWSKL